MAEEFLIELGVDLNTVAADVKLKEIKDKIKNTSNTQPIKLTLNAENVTSQLKSIEKQIHGLSNIKINLSGAGLSGGTSSSVTNSINKTTSAYKELMSLSKQKNNLELKVSSLDKTTKEYAVLKQQLNDIHTEYSKLLGELNGELSTSQLDALSKSFVDLQNKLDVVASKYQDTREKLAQGIIDKTSNGQLDSNFSKLYTSLDKIKTQSAEVVSGMERFKKAESELKAARVSNDTERIIKANQEYENALKNVKNQIDINIQSEKKFADAQKEEQAQAKLEQDRTALSSQMDIWLRNNSAAARDFGEQIKVLQTELQSCDSTRLNGIKAEFQEITRQADLAGKATQTWGDRFKEQVAKFGTYLSAAMLFAKSMQALQGAYDNVVKIDTAMTELKKVTDETSASYNRFTSDAAKSAKEIGTTIDDYITSTADFARLGYNFADAQELSKVANIYNVVGDDLNGIDEATEDIISILKAFNVEAGNSISVVDKLNEVGENLAS